ncbi:MAG: hypothetical protein QM752_07360 [Gammaproteobacteria bacterium]
MHYINNLNDFVRWFIQCLTQSVSSPYYIDIVDSEYDDEKETLLVKIRVRNKRIMRTLSVADFMASPFIYCVHPKQLYLLGYDCGVGDFLVKKEKKSFIHKVKKKFRRVFHATK